MKTKDDFTNELNEVRERLRTIGRDVDYTQPRPDESDLKGDYELPYSSFPKIFTPKWQTTRFS